MNHSVIKRRNSIVKQTSGGGPLPNHPLGHQLTLISFLYLQAALSATSTSIVHRLNPGELVVHSEHDGRLLTVKKDMLGTSFFAKRKFTASVDYRDPKNGLQWCCRRYGAIFGHQIEVRRLCPSREYGSYQNWETASSFLHGQPHLEEVIKEGCPCKPYLDLECDGGLPEGEILETVIAAFEEATVRIFAEDYDLELTSDALSWLPCNYGPGGKFSLHLVVSTHKPQFVYRSNLAPPVDPQGAGHLAKRLRMLLPDHYGSLIDQSVYTRNRGIRLPHCSKPSTHDCRLIPLDDSKPLGDSCITWFDRHVQIIKVPISAPDVV